MWKWISRIIVVAASLVLLLRLADWVSRRGQVLPRVPAPNGYAALVALARDVRLPEGDIVELGPGAVRDAATRNRLVLEQAALRLREPSAVPLETSRGWVEAHEQDVRALRRMAVALSLQARADTLDGRTNDAAKGFVDVILLGQLMARGGILSDGVSALAVEAVGAASLRSLVPHLDGITSRWAAAELEAAEGRRESPDSILQNEKAWSAASFGLVSRVGPLLLRRSETQRRADYLRRHADIIRRTRRLMLRLAVQAVEVETGRPVATPGELVPGILKALPVDPDSGAPIALEAVAD